MACVDRVGSGSLVSAQQNHVTALLDDFRRRHTQIGVVGLGYVGLPLVQAFVRAGFRTIGFDTDETMINRLRRGES